MAESAPDDMSHEFGFTRGLIGTNTECEKRKGGSFGSVCFGCCRRSGSVRFGRRAESLILCPLPAITETLRFGHGRNGPDNRTEPDREPDENNRNRNNENNRISLT